MGESVTINGTKLPWPVILGVLTFTFWLGGLSITVLAQGDTQSQHEAQPAHAEAALATNTVQADVKHNKQEIAAIKRQLEKIETNMEEDKDEILEAIRNAR